MEAKIQRTFVRQEAYLKIHNWILDGTLAPGAKVQDKELSEQLGEVEPRLGKRYCVLKMKGLCKQSQILKTFFRDLGDHETLPII